MTREIVIRIQVPDGIATPHIDYQDEPPHPAAQRAPQKPAGAPASGDHWPPNECPKHGPDRWGESKFGGMYCTAKDESQPKGYCTIKSGHQYNGRLVLE